jgi:hypothetical protein
VLSDQVVTLLSGGTSLIVGTVDDDGMPFAGRAWGIEVLVASDAPRLRVLLDADDAGTQAHAAVGKAIAITAADVRTLVSVQVKGRVVAVEPGPTGEDRTRHAGYVSSFFTAISESDGTDPALLDRFAPLDVVPCTVEVEEVYDQTPGPGAGAALGAKRQ